MTDRVRFDPELLDEDDPFEIDQENAPHLAKHSPYTVEDVGDAWSDEAAVFIEAAVDGPADWLLVARLSGGDIVEIPLAPARSSGWRNCRPIGIYRAGTAATRCYHSQEEL